MCTRMVLALKFSPSEFVHLEINCKYRLPFSALYWDQIQFHQISTIHEWLLVEFHWGQKGNSYFAGKVDNFQYYPVSLRVLCLLCWLVHVLTLLWEAYNHSFLINITIHDIELLEHKPGEAGIALLLPSCGLGLKLLSYLSSFFIIFPLAFPYSLFTSLMTLWYHIP